MDDADRLRGRIEELTVAISVHSLPHAADALSKAAVTVQQLRALTAIVVDDGATTTGLAASFGVSAATMSKLLDRMINQGLLERVPDVSDNRIRRLAASGLGREVVAGMLGARPELGEDVLRGLSQEELAALALGLGAIHREITRGS
ncbi:MAG: MarR family winged helix-turn-helix transcriptional regulator [Microbacterium sp.]|uniref:MarR family winged helix-turn-helix transcriptional regulator n=1 Tax=Microbacterium sp. TaxID=51671 RepID=UPI003D6DEAC3